MGALPSTLLRRKFSNTFLCSSQCEILQRLSALCHMSLKLRLPSRLTLVKISITHLKLRTTKQGPEVIRNTYLAICGLLTIQFIHRSVTMKLTVHTCTFLAFWRLALAVLRLLHVFSLFSQVLIHHSTAEATVENASNCWVKWHFCEGMTAWLRMCKPYRSINKLYWIAEISWHMKLPHLIRVQLSVLQI